MVYICIFLFTFSPCPPCVLEWGQSPSSLHTHTHTHTSELWLLRSLLICHPSSLQGDCCLGARVSNCLAPTPVSVWPSVFCTMCIFNDSAPAGSALLLCLCIRWILVLRASLGSALGWGQGLAMVRVQIRQQMCVCVWNRLVCVVLRPVLIWQPMVDHFLLKRIYFYI